MHRHEGMIRARRMRVNGVGDQFLAGSGFARDQNGRAARRDLRHQVQNLEHALALAHDVRETGALAQRSSEMRVLRFELALRDHPADLDQQLFVVPRLRKIIGRATFQRRDGRLHRPIRGDQENRRLTIPDTDLVQHLKAAFVRHHQVEQDQVVVRRLQTLQSLGGIRRECDAIALRREQHFEAFADIRFVVHH